MALLTNFGRTWLPVGRYYLPTDGSMEVGVVPTNKLMPIVHALPTDSSSPNIQLPTNNLMVGFPTNCQLEYSDRGKSCLHMAPVISLFKIAFLGLQKFNVKIYKYIHTSRMDAGNFEKKDKISSKKKSFLRQ